MDLTLKIRKFNPEEDEKPHWRTFKITADPVWKILDCLMHIKNEHDGTLTFRKSCAHGICGSDAMKINGKAALACQKLVKDYRTRKFVIEPLPGFPVIKDLVVDFDCFFEKLRKIRPWFINDEKPPADSERIQSIEQSEKILDAVKCIFCGSCASSCPTAWVNADYLGPAALLKAYRFIADSRDRGAEERLRIVNDNDGAWRCHTIFNCVEACPKDINVTDHIARLRREIFNRKL